MKKNQSYGAQIMDPQGFSKKKVKSVKEEIAAQKMLIIKEQQKSNYISSQGELGDVGKVIARFAKPKAKKSEKVNAYKV